MTPRELANSVCETLERHGYQALLAGGCVRDILLGREPADYDVATRATPAEVMKLFPDSLAIGAQFGVVILVRGGHKVEIATFRSDGGYSDGRHPDRVVYANSGEEDVQRRDFTINGLLMRHSTGEVLDFVGGRADLAAGVVRAIGDADRRFAEDKLRMLRAARFSARFRFPVENGTLEAMGRHASEIRQVSAERIREELTKILTEGAARRGFEILDETGLLGVLLPEIAAMKGVEQPPEYHPEGDVWIHTRRMIELLPAGCSPTLAWGVLLHDVGKPPSYRSAAETGDRIRFDGHAEIGAAMAEALCEKLRFSRDQTDQIVRLVANHMRFKDAGSMRPATLKRFVRLERFAEHLELHRLDCTSSHRRLEMYDLVRDFIESTPAEEVRPPRLLTGEDLLRMGFRPGPLFSQILRGLEEAQLEGTVRSSRDAEAFVQQHFRDQLKDQRSA